MELRCSQLQQPLVIPTQDSYWGCFSWVDVEQGVDQDQIQASQFVIKDAAFQNRQLQIRTALQQLDDCNSVSFG